LQNPEFAEQLEIFIYGAKGSGMPVSLPGEVKNVPTLAPDDSRKTGANHLRDLLLCMPLLIFVQLLAWLAFLPNALRGHADFRQLYAAGYLVRTGHSHELYDYDLQRQVQDLLISDDERALPFIRPAYQALLFAPFSMLAYRTAYLTFLIANLGLLVLCFVLLRDNMIYLREEWWGLPAALFLAFYPIALAIMQGQDSILLLACLCAALVCLQRGHELTAGVLLGLGLFKLQIVIPIVLLFLLWRLWKFVTGFTMMALTLSAVSILMTGWAQTLVFSRSLLAVGGGADPADRIKFPLRVTLMANLRGLIAGVSGGHVAAIWIHAATITGSILLLMWVAARFSRNSKSDELFLIAVVTSIVVSYYLFIHDLAVLLIPILLTLNRFISCHTGDVASRLAKWGAALMFVAPMLVFFIPGHFYLVSLLICGCLLTLVQAYKLDTVAVNAAAET
jgi:glycosyl transferase family 87